MGVEKAAYLDKYGLCCCAGGNNHDRMLMDGDTGKSSYWALPKSTPSPMVTVNM
jgi:hypothetical protein